MVMRANKVLSFFFFLAYFCHLLTRVVELCSDMIDVVLDVSGIYGLGPSHEAVRAAARAKKAAVVDVSDTLASSNPDLEEEIIDQDSAYDNESASVIRLSNGMVLYLKEVDTMLALVCITRLENFRRKSLINYNISCLKKALQAMAQPGMEIAPAGLVRRVAE